MKGIFHVNTLVPRFRRWNESIEVVAKVIDQSESDSPFPSYKGFGLGTSSFSQKPS
jgi:hypothetical protein